MKTAEVTKYCNTEYHQCKMKCPCCGVDMALVKDGEKLVSYRCPECGLSSTELKKNE
jgi:hypothetical protein